MELRSNSNEPDVLASRQNCVILGVAVALEGLDSEEVRSRKKKKHALVRIAKGSVYVPAACGLSLTASRD